jgi:hypothetical protein
VEREEAKPYSRRELLNLVIGSEMTPSKASRELSRFPSDVGVDLALVGKSDVVKLLNLFILGKRTADQLFDWADFLELRDDVGLENAQVYDVVFYLSNPHMNGPVTVDAAQDFLHELAD